MRLLACSIVASVAIALALYCLNKVSVPACRSLILRASKAGLRLLYRLVRPLLASSASLLRRWGGPRLVIPIILSRTRLEFDARLYVHRLVSEYLSKREPIDDGSSVWKEGDVGNRIWFYWAQGMTSMPDIVKTCYRRLCSTNIDSEVIFLHDGNIHEFVSLPGYILEKIHFNKTHFSDILRVSLLAQYGGVWIDSTCYCADRISSLVLATKRTGFFAYRRNDRDQYMLASWFLISKQKSRICTLIRDVLLYYWAQDDALSNKVFPRWDTTPYFLFHFIFEALYNLDREFRIAWDCSFDLNAYDPHILQQSLLKTFEETEWNRMLNMALVHKLTYRLPSVKDKDGQFSQTFLDYLLDQSR